ncbi:MAG: hypothetical protein HXX13_07540 [Bacteroidetes bacterium]|nr:hypothetical protein [Bacteroidota bacterium]
MKHIRQILLITGLLLALLATAPSAFAQEPPHPPTTGHGQTGNQNPSNTAPLDGGLSVLVALGLFYGTKKTGILKAKDSE